MSDIHDKAPAFIERRDDRSMSPVVAAGLRILEQNPSPDTLRELLAVQREFEANEARKAYAAALVGLKTGLPAVIAHDKLVEFNTTKYTHTTLAAAVEAVSPHLINHGFVHSWHPSNDRANEVAVTCRLTHCLGHFEEVTLRAAPDAKGGKNGAQAVASSVTMLQRYTLLALLGIATADQNEIFDGGDQGGDEEEPQQPSPGGKVDSARNLRAVGRLKQLNRTRQQAEDFLGRSVSDWTDRDLEALSRWAKAPLESVEP